MYYMIFIDVEQRLEADLKTLVVGYDIVKVAVVDSVVPL